MHLTYIGSACQDDASVAIEESAGRVTLTVRTTVRAGSCPDVGVPYTIDAQLDAPLGDRELIDGACEMSELSHTECSSKKPTR